MVSLIASSLYFISLPTKVRDISGELWSCIILKWCDRRVKNWPYHYRNVWILKHFVRLGWVKLFLCKGADMLDKKEEVVCKEIILLLSPKTASIWRFPSKIIIFSPTNNRNHSIISQFIRRITSTMIGTTELKVDLHNLMFQLLQTIRELERPVKIFLQFTNKI